MSLDVRFTVGQEIFGEGGKEGMRWVTEHAGKYVFLDNMGPLFFGE
jgi:hypothetical protein